MDKTRKELVLIFLINATNNIGNLWGPTFPYIASYANHYNESVTMNYLFGCMLFLFLGSSLANFLLPTFYELFGLRYSFLIGAILYLLNCLWFCSIPNRLFIGLQSILGGITYQFIVMTTNLFFFEKYPEQAKTLVAISVSGTMVGNFIWSPLLSYIVNPNNAPPTVVRQSGDNFDNYFDIAIAEKVIVYLSLNGVFALVLTIIAWFWLEDPDQYMGTVIRKLKGIEDNDNDSTIRLSRKDIERSLNNSVYHSYSKQRRLNTSRDDTLELVSELDRNVSIQRAPDDEPEDSYKEELHSAKFWYIYAICFFRMTALAYYIDNFKVIGLYMVRDDELINNTWGMAAISGFVANFSASYIWRKFDMIYSYYLLFGLSLLLLVTFQFFGDNRFYFVFFGLLLRYDININRIFNYYSLFEIYRANVAMQLSKWFETVNTFGFVIVILLNDLLVSGGNFVLITWVYIGSFMIGLYLVGRLSVHMKTEKSLIIA